MAEDDWVEPPETEVDVEKIAPVKKRMGRPPGGGDRPGMNRDARMRQDRAKKKLQALGADLEPIIDTQVRLLEWHQESFLNQSTEGRAASQRYLTEDDVIKLDKLTKMVKDLGDLKIRWLIAAQKFGAGLTPHQVMEASIARILQQPAETRKRVIKRLYDEHNGMMKPGAFQAGATIGMAEDQRQLEGHASVPTQFQPKEGPVQEKPVKTKGAVDAMLALLEPIEKDSDAGI